MTRTLSDMVAINSSTHVADGGLRAQSYIKTISQKKLTHKLVRMLVWYKSAECFLVRPLPTPLYVSGVKLLTSLRLGPYIKSFTITMTMGTQHTPGRKILDRNKLSEVKPGVVAHAFSPST